MSGKKKINHFFIDASGGVDITSDIWDVSVKRASYMKNLISDGVGSRKRRGIHQICKFTDKNGIPLRINGIHSYISDKGELAIFHAGCDFYRENGEKIPSSVEITDTPSLSFQLGGALYIIGCGGIFVYDGDTLQNAVPYIPVIYRGYDSYLEADEQLEGENIMSTLCIAEYCGKKHSKEAVPFFRFPKNVSDSHSVTATVSISGVTNELYVCSGNEPDPDNDTKISHPVSAVFRLDPKESWHGRTKRCDEITVDGGSLYILDPLSTTEHIIYPKMTVSGDGRSFYFNFNTESELPNEMSVRVLFTDANADISHITECTVGEVIQDSRGQSRLVLSGNPRCPSKIFFSDVIRNKCDVYFPSECAVSVDTDSPVTAFMKLSDTYLGVFKADRFFRYAFTHRPEGKTAAERHIINGYESRDTVGCINPRVCGRQGSDLLVFDGKAVFGIDTVSGQTDRPFLAERSRNIKKGLISHTDEEALLSCACMQDGKYYLFIGGKVYIADTYKDFSDKNTPSDRQYEWWIWDGIHASCVRIIKGKMYIGDRDGGISVIGNDFRDIRIHKTAGGGDALYSEADGLFTLDPSMIPDGQFFVRLPGECSFLENGEFSAFIHTSFGKTRTVILPASPSLRAITGALLAVITKSGDKILCFHTLYEDDGELGIFSLADSSGELINIPAEDIDSIRISDNGSREYTLKRFGNRFATYEGEEAVSWYSLPTPAPITVYTYAPVESVYVSALTDFNEPICKKSLYGVGVRANDSRGESLSFGYVTDKNQRDFQLRRGGFDLSGLDLNRISFTLPLGRICERRVFERNISSLLFFLKSEEATDLRVKGFYAAYSKNK